jgi:hypothetical protein
MKIMQENFGGGISHMCVIGGIVIGGGIAIIGGKMELSHSFSSLLPWAAEDLG